MADTGSDSIDIDAPQERVLEVVLDVEAYPDWMPAFKKAKVTQRDSEGRPAKAEFEVDAMIRKLAYVLEYSYPPDGVAWKMVKGDPKKIDGSYVLEDRSGATKVTYNYEIDAGFPVPGFLRKQGVRMMVTSALHDLKKRAES